MPDWCQELTFSCPMLFPFETRLLYFQCTAFGASRSIVWLQNQRDANAERARAGARGLSRGLGGADDLHEFRVGRIKHERVKVRQQFPMYSLSCALKAIYRVPVILWNWVGFTCD